mmetsp:Transcript_80416/g.162884  ORF Transcript_80416/g.162884 Transcript_80416/m.162884 type:complete len:85 (-) Transcript_80416:1125-1379(-)
MKDGGAVFQYCRNFVYGKRTATEDAVGSVNGFVRKKERIVHFAKGCVVGKTDCDTMLHQEVSHSLQPNQTNKGKYRHENFRVGG